jgi:cytochrome c-type biogenesis protein CcmH/NrfG
LIMAGLTQAYTGLGQTEKAIAAGRVAYRVQPSSPVVSHLYGLALMADRGRNKDGISLLKKAVAIMPKNQVYQKSLRLALAAQRADRGKVKS